MTLNRLNIINRPRIGSLGGGQSWASNLFGQSDLNTWIKSGTRSGVTLPDTITPGTNDASILLPYLYKPTGNEYAVSPAVNDFYVGSTSITIAGWFKCEGTDKSVLRVLIGKSTGSQGTCYIGMDATTGYLAFRFYSDTPFETNVIVSDIDFTTAGWVFLRAEINTVTKVGKFFINEVQVGADEPYTGIMPTVDGSKFYVGSYGAGTIAAKCSVSDCYVYRRILTPAEGATLMARGFVTGAEAHWTFSELINYSTNLFYDVTGNGKHLTAVNLTSAKRSFGIQGSRYLLDHGYTLHANLYLKIYFYVGNTYAGNQILSDSVMFGGYTFTKLVKRNGSISNYNKAESLISFAGANYDRSNATIYNAQARLGYYDAAHPKYWRSLELDQELIDSFFTKDYRDIHFLKGNTDSLDTCNYLEEFISYNTVKTDADKDKVLSYTKDKPLPLDYIDITCIQTAVISQVSLILVVDTNRRVFIDWGDGTAVVTCTGSNTYTSNYTSAGTYHIKIYRDLDSLTGFTVNNATLSGNISEFNKATGLTTLSINNGNWAGDIDALTSPLIALTLNYVPGCYGSIDSLPVTIKNLMLYGTSIQVKNNYYGSLDNLPPNLETLALSSIINGQITGDTDNLPASLLRVDWEYTELNITGKLDTLPSRAVMTHFCGSGPGSTWTGSMNSLTSAALDYVSFSDMPNVTLNIGTIQDSVKKIIVAGTNNGNISGNLNAVPTTLEQCCLTDSTGVTGNLEDLPATINRLVITNCPNVIYNSGNLPTWVFTANCTINNSWNSATVDAFLINAATRFGNATGQHIYLNYTGMGARTAASDAAVATLLGKGYTVHSN